MKNKTCCLCNRKLENKSHKWLNGFVDMRDLKNICDECDLSFNEQLITLIKEIEKINEVKQINKD